MVAPRAKRAIVILATIIAAIIISSVSLAYLLFLSPKAQLDRIESSADKHFIIAQQALTDISNLAENDDHISSLQQAAKHQKTEGKRALEEAKKANESYIILINRLETDDSNYEQIKSKIKASNYLVKSAKNFSPWLDEVKSGTLIIEHTNDAFSQQSNGVDLLNQAINKANAGNNKQALDLSNKSKEGFGGAKKTLVKVQKSFSNQDIGQLKIALDLYLDATGSVKKMSELENKDPDSYNKEVDKLNKATERAAKIVANNPISKDLDGWLAENFYYAGSQLIYNYKKATDVWPK
ncbi:MAG: hypothetical protein E3J54_05870 [Actinobacteria bacterium]|nr:MAG: hypothetical protein E3J54_05870 [Actinomycetota bacterium]